MSRVASRSLLGRRHAGACGLRNPAIDGYPGLGRGRPDLCQSRRGWPRRDPVGARGRHGGDGRAAVHASIPTCNRPTSTMAKAALTNAHAGLRPRAVAAQDRGRHAEGAGRRRSDACARRRRGSTRRRPGSRAARWQARSPGRSSRSISGPANWCRPAGRWSRSCRPAISRSGSSCREAVLPKIALGDAVAIHCDGCDGRHDRRKVSFISRTSEFTPPVIYSLEERNKLVFLIEALPDTPGRPARRPAGQRHVRGDAASERK